MPEMVSTTNGEAIKVVGVRRKAGEPLGLTVQVDDNKNLVIARILEGGTIDKQGLLSVGDVILEINGVAVYTPEDLQTEIAKAKDSVTIKIGQANEQTHASLVSNSIHNNKISTVSLLA